MFIHGVEIVVGIGVLWCLGAIGAAIYVGRAIARHLGI